MIKKKNDRKKKRCSINVGFWMALNCHSVCFGGNMEILIVPVFSDLTKASSSIYAPLVKQVGRGNR